LYSAVLMMLSSSNMRHERSSRARRCATSRQQNGARTAITITQRQYASATGDIAPAIARPTTIFPAQNKAVQARSAAGE
jgi:hypothetical protein